jgi:hypothetical protein
MNARFGMPARDRGARDLSQNPGNNALVLDMYVEGVTQELRDAAIGQDGDEDSSQAERLVAKASRRRKRRQA